MHPTPRTPSRPLLLLAVAALVLSAAPARAEPPQPDCYVLAVGVDDFQSPLIPKLKGCANDARLMARRLEAQRGRAFAAVESRVLVNEEATAANVESGMAWLGRVSRPGDFAVLVLSSHGGARRGGWALVAHDTAPGAGEGEAITDAQILEVAHGLAGRGLRVLVLIDACQAGQVRLRARRQLTAEAYPRGAGIVLMLSSMPGQGSAALGGFSAFAEAVGEGLEGKADLDGDGRVTLGELRRYAYHRVYALLRERGQAGWQDGECDWSLSLSEDLTLARVDRRAGPGRLKPVRPEAAAGPRPVPP
jgi:hypothetical protein